MPVNMPLMSQAQAVKEVLAEVLDERTRMSQMWGFFHAAALLKMGAPGINPSFNTAVTLELIKQLKEDRFAKFMQELKELKGERNGRLP
jgi:hypothetical protein